MTVQRRMVLLLLPFITTIVLFTGDACAFSLGYRYHATRTGATQGSFQCRTVGLPRCSLRCDASHQQRQNPCHSTTRQWSPLLASSRTALKSGIIITTVGRRTCLSSSHRLPSARMVLHASVGDDVAPDNGESNSDRSASSSASTTTWIQRLRRSVSKAYQPKEDGLTFRQRLAKMGLATVLSYGWVSNMSYGVSVSTAWYIFSKQVRV
jgi:hypothetical protein